MIGYVGKLLKIHGHLLLRKRRQNTSCTVPPFGGENLHSRKHDYRLVCVGDSVPQVDGCLLYKDWCGLR
ncbi:MAG: hypothetical protein U0Y96_06525 [Candidatus Kapaibacterium sp.]|nr:hypothetical protein [Bacteroidota bacterium]